MKKEIKKLNKLLKKEFSDKNVRAGIIVYFCVIFFGKKPAKLAKKLQVDERKIIAGVVRISGKLMNDLEFYKKMHNVCREFFLQVPKKRVA